MHFTIQTFTSQYAGEDLCAGPNNIRQILIDLRAPYSVETSDVEECLFELANGADEQEVEPRIEPGKLLLNSYSTLCFFISF